MTLTVLVTYACIGALAGLMSGALGIGGGTIVVPGLLFIFQTSQHIPADMSMRVAAGTSLAIMVFTAQASMYAHNRFGTIDWPVFNRLWPGLLVGGVAGGLLIDSIPPYWLHFFFAVFLLLLGCKMLLDLRTARQYPFPPAWANFALNFLIGLQAVLLGIGGGLFIALYLNCCGLAGRKVSAITNLCTLTVAVVGAIIFALMGLQAMAQVPYATGYVYWPAVLGVMIFSVVCAPLGVRLAYTVPLKYLRLVFVFILFSTAMQMIL